MGKPNKPYVNDIGTNIILNTGVDLSDATLVKILVLKPFDAVEEWVSTVHSDGFSVKFISVGAGLNAYQELGLNINLIDDSGISVGDFFFKINSKEYKLTTTNVLNTYQDLIDSLNTLLNSDNISVGFVAGDIRFSHMINSYKNNILIEDIGFFKFINTFISFETPIKAVVSSFDRPGIYNLQAYIETPSFSGRGETVELEVYDEFK